MITRIAVAALFTLGAMSCGGARASSAPLAGTYSFVVSNGHIQGPSECSGNPLFYYAAGEAFLFWPGLGTKGAILRKSDDISGGAKIRITTLPLTPHADGGGWQGPLTTHTFPSDSTPNTGTWFAKTTFVDSNSFLLHYILKAGGCTLTNDVTLIRVGS